MPHVIVPDEVRFHRHAHPEPNTGCWLWSGGLNDAGYAISLGEGGKRLLGHRVSWRLFRGPIPDGMFILHSCHVRACVNPDHLRPGTNQENMDDMKRANRQQRGARHFKTKLTVPQMKDAIRRVRAGEQAKDVALSLGLSPGAVGHIMHGRQWLARQALSEMAGD